MVFFPRVALRATSPGRRARAPRRAEALSDGATACAAAALVAAAALGDHARVSELLRPPCSIDVNARDNRGCAARARARPVRASKPRRRFARARRRRFAQEQFQRDRAMYSSDSDSN